MFTTMRSIRGGLKIARTTRWYATMAEYRLDFSHEKAAEIQETFGGPIPTLAHFTTDAPQLKDHNAAVLDQLAKVNKDDVKMKLIWADIANRESQMWLQSMGGKSAPLIVAVQKGQVLDTHGGLCTEDFLNSFLTKFVNFASDSAPSDVASEIDETTPAGRFAKLALEAQNGKTPPEEVQAKLQVIITEIDDLLKAEKKAAPQKKLSGPPTATPTEELMARVLVFQCATTQVTDNAAAAEQLEKVKIKYSKFSIKEINKSIASLEMVIASSFTFDPIEIYQTAVETATDEEERKLASHRLAVALFRADRHQAGIDRLLELLKKDKNGPAKTSLVSAFAILGADSEITIAGRKKMMSYLF
eukprot:TRINITY_DN9422_c0_g1_i1.p1 TRINITY_DN9422_c0_g1~~TRINITY_DN9422_c0_g1_i1.p1  ORF type:complete len:377 (+),score=65.85 TRINITY_DN9422_c0_g1_i1:57-1133(+)